MYKIINIEIQHKIESIRQWRQHQKQLTEQKMKSNTLLADEINGFHMKNLQRQAQREQLQLRKILARLKQTTEIKIKENDQIYDSERIFKVLSETDDLRQSLKNKGVDPEVKTQQNYQELVSQMDHLHHIFKKQVQNDQQSKKENKINSQQLKKEMDQIDNQLRQIEQLLADQPTNKSGPSKKKDHNTR